MIEIVVESIAQHPFAAALLALVSLGLAFGALLGFAAEKFKAEGNPVVEQINAILPQTQCGQCGFPGCRPYAEAIAADEAPINRCPPGGEAGIAALADLLDVEAIPLDEEHGEEKAGPLVAYIREDECIGCTKCIQACPVDAILGAAKLMHTVIAAECTGCDLCLDPCPVDCIELRGEDATIQNWHWDLPAPRTSPVIIATDGVTDGATDSATDSAAAPNNHRNSDRNNHHNSDRNNHPNKGRAA